MISYIADKKLMQIISFLMATKLISVKFIVIVCIIFILSGNKAWPAYPRLIK